jgi:hypothetical protein
MKSEQVLNTMGIEKDTYPADAVFERFNLIGTYSKDRKTVCIMIEDNVDEILQEDIRNLHTWNGSSKRNCFDCR